MIVATTRPLTSVKGKMVIFICAKSALIDLAQQCELPKSLSIFPTRIAVRKFATDGGTLGCDRLRERRDWREERTYCVRQSHGCSQPIPSPSISLDPDNLRRFGDMPIDHDPLHSGADRGFRGGVGDQHDGDRLAGAAFWVLLCGNLGALLHDAFQ